MSGAYNGGWEVWQVKRKGRYAKYDNRIVVIVGVGEYKRFLLTHADLKALGNPTHVSVMVRGTNVALLGTNNSDEGYSVTLGKPAGRTGRVGLANVNAVAFIKEKHLQSGVYDAHVEGNMLIFDISQIPAKL